MRTCPPVGAVSRLVASLALAATACFAATAFSAPHASAPSHDPFEEQVDSLVRDGFEHPSQSVSLLRQLQREHSSLAAQRLILLSIGVVEARGGSAAQARAVADQLLALSPEDPGGRAAAASNLVRAEAAATAGQVDVAAAYAQQALPAFMAGCPSVPAFSASTAPAPMAASTPPGADASQCDYRSAWRVLRILERRAETQGVYVTAAALAESGLRLAEWAGDTKRQTTALAALAWLAQDRGERELAQRYLAQARRTATQPPDPAQQSRLSNTEAHMLAERGDRKSALQAREEAYSLAAQANEPRLEAQMLANLSDAYARMNRHAEALNAAERALVIVRSHSDLRAERVLINNAGIAKIGLGRLAEGKQDLARLLELWQSSGEKGRQAATMREFGEALAAAGDARAALDLYHREREISDDLMRLNRKIALDELQTRNDAQARQRDIELMARDNALKAEELSNRDLLQSIWWLVAAVMLLACVLVAMLYRRVRQTHRNLAASHAQLRVQSERDPLTNLANRRHFQAVMAQLEKQGSGFEGALLLVDIDHFKNVNDTHGHACGDQVLVEVARRLNEAVRSDDLVVRWGGEEFLILAPRAAPEQAEQMATRVLGILASTPIVAGGKSLRVTASIGYARFPLPPHDIDVPWEQAINFADMALYTAKNQGRNRAVGITSSTADTREALKEVEADFEQAWRDGQVSLLQTFGPAVHEGLRVA